MITCHEQVTKRFMMRGLPIYILIFSLLGIVVAYDINVTDLPQLGKSCHKGIGILLPKLF